MSDEDKDVDIESDDEDLGSSASISGDNRSGNGSYSQADKRAHHNALERKRRDHIKDSFSGLRDSVPSLHGEKASRAQILKKAAEYISIMRRKNTTAQADIDDLKRQNKVLEEQIRTLEKAKAAGITAGEFTGASLLEGTGHLAKIKTESVSSFDGVSDSDSVSDVDGMANGSSAGSSSGSLIGKKRGASNGQSTKRIKSANTSESMSALTNAVM